MDPGPEPWECDFLGSVAEFGSQQRFPDQLVTATPHPAPDPGSGGLPLQLATVRQEPEEGERSAHPEPIRNGER